MKTSYKLHITISALFLVLIVPLFSGLIYYSYQSNLALAKKEANTSMERAKAETLKNIIGFVEPIADSVRSTAQLGSIQPNFFRAEESGQLLVRAVQNNRDILSYYVGFEDGSFRQGAAIDPAVPVFDRLPPPEARFANRMIDRSKNKKDPVDSYIFLKDWGQRVGESNSPASYDPRTAPFFKAAVARGTTGKSDAILISDPYIIRSTGQPGFSISASMISNGKLVGVAAANLRLKRISEYLAESAISPNSMTIIVDRDSNIVAHPNSDEAYSKDAKKTQRKLSDLPNPAVQSAVAERIRTGKDSFVFTEYGTNKEFMALFSPFPPTFNKPWEVMVIAPLSDFVGEINENNRRTMAVGIVALLLIVLLTYVVSRRLSRPLEVLVEEIKQVLSFQISPGLNLKSRVSEIGSLIDATQKLKTAINAFAAYVPRELVSDLIHSGKPIAPGGESRYLTMFFTDLQGFSSLAEITPTRQLLDMVSSYLSMVTHAVKEERGTIDKFIGDAVMAFWGAPLLSEDHAYRACVAAVRSQRRMRALNEQFAAVGQSPLVVRIGIHTDAVLVGNIGSLERLSYTVMGDGVNIASRLEGINKDFGTRICVSHSVFKEAGERLWLRPIDEVSVKGRKGEFLIYELVAIRDGDDEVSASSDDQKKCVATEKAFGLYSQGQWLSAISCYEEIASEFDDALSREMIVRCRAAMTNGQHDVLLDSAQK
jgi:adenylate cyclase